MESTPTIKHVTPSGIEYEVKEYLVTEEIHAYDGASASALHVTGYRLEGKNAVPEFGDVDMAKVSRAAEYKLIELAIVSLDGSAENIRQRVLQLRLKDYTAIKDQIEKLVTDPN